MDFEHGFERGLTSLCWSLRLSMFPVCHFRILESVRKYCGACGVSAGHTRKIKHLVERDHLRASIQNHMEFLLALPEGLVVELFHEARAKTLAFHPFFSEIGSANLVMESHLCNKAVKELYLLERDLMFYANQSLDLL